MYIAIADNGGKSGTCPDMDYHRPKQYLIRISGSVDRLAVEDILKKCRETRIGVHIVGAWGG